MANIDEEWPLAVLFFPPIAFMRAIILLLRFGGSTIAFGSDLSNSLILMFCTGSVFLVIGPYLHAVLPGQQGTGIVSHPLFCCSKRWWAKSCGRLKVEPSGRAITASLLTPPGGDDDEEHGLVYHEDPDVAQERERVSHTAPSNVPILINSLRKVYQGGYSSTAKVAVGNFCLVVDPGETFGMLGSNGAGKTTVLSCLAGNIEPTAGEAFIGGYSTATELDYVYKLLGVCPQFDVVHTDLTVETHLQFYARCKGVSPERLAAEVMITANKVGLSGDAFGTPAGELSGGMRRRLSLGIALLGNAPVVLLDEPTTGLDPDTRRSIWDIIHAERVNAGRSMIITSHNLEEVDVLCSRIGIMTHGRLQCVGTPQHLKDRFGGGFRLGITLHEKSHAARVDAFVKESLTARATRTSLINTSVMYNLPREHVSLADVFARMEDAHHNHLVQFWEVSQTSLEEVFIRVVENDETQDD